jgi:hypothetical protein
MDELKTLVEKLEHSYSDRLVAVILYGSGAAEDSGDHHHKFSDLNVLCVLKEITPRELADGEPIMRWWREHGHPSPLLMSEEEAHRSADCFPIEFRDMQDRRKVLFGVDVIAGVHVSLKHYRTQVEYELRSKLLRLRQQGAQVLSDPAALLKLCVDSVATFCMLGRHALLVSGIDLGKGPAGNRRDVVHRLREKLGASGSPFDILLDIREGKPAAVSGPNELFAEYLEFIRKMVEFVDQLPV